jgi:hypothetical protein
LPETAETLWLRLLGRGQVQARAMLAVADLPDSEPLRDATMRLLLAWQQGLPPTEEQNLEQRAMRANLEKVYERWEQKTLAKGRVEGKAEGKAEGQAEGKAEGKAEGIAEGKAEALLLLLRVRGLTVSASQRARIQRCGDVSQLDTWLEAAVTAESVTALLRPRAPGSRR